MPRRKPKSVTLEFDPGTGAFRDLSSGLVYGPGNKDPAGSAVISRGPGSRALARSLGLPYEPQRFIESSPPGMVGYWSGKGTRNDPRKFHGLPEKIAGYGLLALILTWGFEQLEMDISNWWGNSVLNIGADLSKLNLTADAASSLGLIPKAVDTSGTVTKAAPRKPLALLDWLAGQVLPAGSTIDAVAVQVDSLSGSIAAGGLSAPPTPNSGLSGVAPTFNGGNPSQPSSYSCPSGYKLTPIVGAGAVKWTCVPTPT